MSLSGKRVVITRPRDQAEGLGRALEARGASAIYLPTIAIEPPQSWGPVDEAIEALRRGSYDWVAFTSTNGVRGFLSCLDDPAALRDVKVAAVGKATAAELDARGITSALVPAESSAADLARALGTTGTTILLPRAEEVPSEMTDVLANNGWQPHEVAVYRTVPAPRTDAADQIEAGDFDAITFSSASSVRGFLGMDFDIERLCLTPTTPPQRLVACIGPVTAAACGAWNLRVDAIADERTSEGLAGRLASAFERGDRRAMGT